MSLSNTRRNHTRLPLDIVYSEYVAERQTLGIISDISERGLRVQRLLRGRTPDGIVQLEFELPGTGETIWAKGFIRFDQLWRRETALLRTSGVRVVAAAQKHLRMMRDWVMAMRAEDEEDDRAFMSSALTTVLPNRS